MSTLHVTYGTDAQHATTSPLLSPEEAGAFLRTHPRTLANWRVLGRGPRFVRVGRSALYRQSDLDEFVNARVYDSTGAETRLSGGASCSERNHP